MLMNIHTHSMRRNDSGGEAHSFHSLLNRLPDEIIPSFKQSD